MPRIVKRPVKWAKGRPIAWGEFTDGRPRRLIRGVDFDGSIRTLQSRAHNAAKRAGMRAQTKADGSDMLIQFVALTRPAKRAAKT